MSAKKTGMKSSDLRDNWAQKKYRDQSKAQNKKTKHVAHYFSLDIAAFINQFVKPTVTVNTLKSLCNDPQNFRMIDAKTNLSNHKQIDNKLMNSFQIMLEKLNGNKIYKKLLKTNPCKLELEMRKNEINCIILKGVEASRAVAQTKRVQKLNFPNHYTAFTRFFYRCFKDSKQREIWNDRGNTTEFRKYLKMQQQNVQSTNNDDEKEETMNYDHITNNKQQYMKSDMNEDKIIGKDNKNRILYQGGKGGTYYMTESGRKTYIKSENKTSLSPKYKDYNDDDRKYGVDDKGRTLYEGSKGGIYYITESGKKKYAKSDNDGKKEKRKRNNKDDRIYGLDDKGRRLYEGGRGGIYYITESGKKMYAKSDKLSSSSKYDEIVYGSDDKGRTLYQGKKGGIYYKTPSGNKTYVKKK